MLKPSWWFTRGAFFVNAAVESLAFGLTFVFPGGRDLLAMEVPGDYYSNELAEVYLQRWAIGGMGVVAALIAVAPEEEISKFAYAVGFSCYHVPLGLGFTMPNYPSLIGGWPMHLVLGISFLTYAGKYSKAKLALTPYPPKKD